MLSCLISNLIILVFNYKTLHYFIVVVYLFKGERGQKSMIRGYREAYCFLLYLQHVSVLLLDCPELKLLIYVLFSFLFGFSFFFSCSLELTFIATFHYLW